MESENTPGTSSASIIHVDPESETFPFVSSYNTQDITDGLKLCCENLRSLNICEEKPSDNISNKAKLLGEKMTEVIIELLEDFDFYEDYEVLLPNEVTDDKSAEVETSDASSPEKSEISSKTTSSSTSVLSVSDNEEFEQPPSKISKTYVPLTTKIKIVNLAREHPKWSLKTLQKMGGSLF